MLIDCDYNEKNDYTKTGNYMVSTGRVTTFSWVCENYTKDSKIQCLVKEYESSSWQSPVTACGKGITIKSWWWRSWGWWGGWGSKPPVVDVEKCFNVNEWNVSIEKWEYLPFYLNIEKNKSWDYVVFEKDSYPFGDKNTYSKMKNNVSCKWITWWYIALNSLVCNYKILDGSNKSVETWSFPCLNNSGYINTGMVWAWIEWQRKTYDDDMDSFKPNRWTSYTFRSNVNTVDTSKWKENVYWEYKLQLTSLDYLYCDWIWKEYHTEGENENVICQSNFTLTNSYTVQKTPSGNFTNTSTDQLRNYLYANGESTFDMATLLNKIAWTSAYDPTKKVETAMENFINKYKKLAVNVNLSKDSFLEWTSVKKVPGKNIYFVNGDITIKWSSSKIQNPFTIVQTSWKTTIKWNVQHNMMLLTKWKIIFEDTNTCNPKVNQERQTVKWIFYAQSWLERKPVLKNNDINAYRWCSEWWLTVKWVLIGRWLNDLMKNSRSNLTNWWDNKTAQTVMNWASVLIEYSPSIFTKSTMPPGAEDFTTALTVYKN